MFHPQFACRPRAESLEPRRLLAVTNLDPTFGTRGIAPVDVPAPDLPAAARDVFVLPDGKALVAGSSLFRSPFDVANPFALARYNPDGSLDTTFGGGDGIAAAPPGHYPGFRAVTVQPDGRIVAAGSSNNVVAVARFLPGGAPDPTFDEDGIVTSGLLSGSARDVDVLPDGRILVAADGFAILRFLSDGRPDTSFGNGDGVASVPFFFAGGTGSASDVLPLADGRILASGEGVRTVGTRRVRTPALARLTPDGSLDATFGTGGVVLTVPTSGVDAVGNDLTVAADGDFLVAGQLGTSDGFLFRYDSSGVLDTTFDGDGMLTVPGTPLVAVGVQPSGRVVAGAAVALGRNLPELGFAVYGFTPAGVADSTFGGGDGQALAFAPPTGGRLEAMDVTADGRIVAAGTWQADIALARFSADGSADPTFGGGDGEVFTNLVARERVATKALARDARGRLYVAANRAQGTSIDAAAAVLRLNPDGTFDNSFGASGYAFVPAGVLPEHARAEDLLVTSAGRVVVTVSMEGRFALVGYRPDGSLDPTFGDGGIVRTETPAEAEGAFALDVAEAPGGKLVVSGRSTTGRSAIARFNADGSLDASFGGDGFVVSSAATEEYYRHVVVQPDGKVVTTGARYLSPIPDPFVARFNADGTPDATFDGDGEVVGVGGPVALAPDGKILVAAGVVGRFAVYRLNQDGSPDTTFGEDGRVTTAFFERGNAYSTGTHFLWVNADGSFYAAGFATWSGGGLPDDRIAVAGYNPDGSPLTGFGDAGRVLLPDLVGLSFGIGGGLVATDDGRPVVLLTGEVDSAVTRLLRTPAPVAAAIAGRHVFYKGSAYDDGGTAFPDPRDDNAIAGDKRALLPGQAATFANVVSAPLNAIMIDFRDLPLDATPASQDLVVRTGNSPDPSTWADHSEFRYVTLTRGAGVGGSDRLTVYWSNDHRPVRNAWLQVTVKAGNQTGLPADDVFYYGSLFGETGDGGATGANSFRVSALDLAAVRRSLGRDATITNPLDVIRDGRITALDVAVVRQNLGRSLVRLTAPPAAPVVALPTLVFESDKTIRAAQVTEDVLTS